MHNREQLIQRDLQHIWHPCTQMKDLESVPPLIVYRAQGSYLHTDQGPVIDAISSWWCKSLGHAHPAITEAIISQLNSFEHVIAANTTNASMVKLGEKLASITKNQHIFFASDGSCAVEIAMKLALHAMQLKGELHRNEFVALENSYHGETLGTLSVSDLKLYKKPYEGLGVKCHFLDSLPYVINDQDPIWSNIDDYWPLILKQLEPLKEKVCAILVEPIVQGAGGMRCYSANFLKRLADWAKQNGIYLIADEIMTGIGRTGKWLACQHAEVQPDLICLSKGLTSGTLPLSCVLINHQIYGLFYGDYNQGNSFLHSHTYSGNALAISAALATLNVIEKEGINEQARKLGLLMEKKMQEIAGITHKLSQVRTLGAWVAADLIETDRPRIGYQVYQQALKLGALIRPLGNTIYWLPPLNTSEKTIEQLAEITLHSIEAAYSF